MKTDYIELYTDYLIRNKGKATVTGVSVIKANQMVYQELLLLKGT